MIKIWCGHIAGLTVGDVCWVATSRDAFIRGVVTRRGQRAVKVLLRAQSTNADMPLVDLFRSRDLVFAHSGRTTEAVSDVVRRYWGPPIYLFTDEAKVQYETRRRAAATIPSAVDPFSFTPAVMDSRIPLDVVVAFTDAFEAVHKPGTVTDEVEIYAGEAP